MLREHILLRWIPPREKDHCVSLLTFFFLFGFCEKTTSLSEKRPDEDTELSKLFPSLILIKVETHTHAHAHRALDTRKTNWVPSTSGTLRIYIFYSLRLPETLPAEWIIEQEADGRMKQPLSGMMCCAIWLQRLNWAIECLIHYA